LPAISKEDEPDCPDWIRFDGRLYFLQGPPADPVKLGRVVVTVRCQLIGSGTQVNYEPRDGDATSISRGTRVFQVAGATTSAMLATNTHDGLELWRPEK
jgi:broad specificity polyphosphatase/5'/3'-nucleotidase SurE